VNVKVKVKVKVNAEAKVKSNFWHNSKVDYAKQLLNVNHVIM